MSNPIFVDKEIIPIICSYCKHDFIVSQINTGKTILNTCNREPCQEKLKLEMSRLRSEVDECFPLVGKPKT